VLVDTPLGKSLALVKAEDHVKSVFNQTYATANGKAVKQALTAAEFESALMELKPFGGIATTKEISEMIATMYDRHAPSVITDITRHCKNPKDKFYPYRQDKLGGWCMPGQHMEGCGETVQSQLNSMHDVDAKRFN
jgi:hypothetical protein